MDTVSLPSHAFCINSDNVTPEKFLAHFPTLKNEMMRKRAFNWREYTNDIFSEIRQTGATHVTLAGTGFEATALELWKGDSPLQCILRIELGSTALPQVNGILPFYRDQLYYHAGDVEQENPPAEGDYTKLPKTGYPYAKGMRISVMPKVIRLPALCDEYGNLNEEISDLSFEAMNKMMKQLNTLLVSQGHLSLDSHPKNLGLYCSKSGAYIPVLFDPGKTISLLYPQEKTRLEERTQLRAQWANRTNLNEGHSWLEPVTWRSLRQEIREDGDRLYRGETTHYAKRMADIIQAAGNSMPAVADIALMLESKTSMSFNR